jgi:hypothetical protein
MSEVISFRLDRENPREAQALAVLNKGQEAGYSLRHVLTEALLALESAAEDEQAVAVTLNQMTRMLAEMQAVLEVIQNRDFSAARIEEPKPEQDALAESFLLSVKNTAKSGLVLASE